jgi:hypothetical protein
MGHSSIRVTQEIYIDVCAEVFDRFFMHRSASAPTI